MNYLYRRGRGAKRRVMHLSEYDPRSGRPLLTPICGSNYEFNTTINVPMGQPVCKRCKARCR